jgi:hypothetical protein
MWSHTSTAKQRLYRYSETQEAVPSSFILAAANPTDFPRLECKLYAAIYPQAGLSPMPTPTRYIAGITWHLHLSKHETLSFQRGTNQITSNPGEMLSLLKSYDGATLYVVEVDGMALVQLVWESTSTPYSFNRILGLPPLDDPQTHDPTTATWAHWSVAPLLLPIEAAQTLIVPSHDPTGPLPTVTTYDTPPADRKSLLVPAAPWLDRYLEVPNATKTCTVTIRDGFTGGVKLTATEENEDIEVISVTVNERGDTYDIEMPANSGSLTLALKNRVWNDPDELQRFVAQFSRTDVVEVVFGWSDDTSGTYTTTTGRYYVASVHGEDDTITIEFEDIMARLSGVSISYLPLGCFDWVQDPSAENMGRPLPPVSAMTNFHFGDGSITDPPLDCWHSVGGLFEFLLTLAPHLTTTCDLTTVLPSTAYPVASIDPALYAVGFPVMTTNNPQTLGDLVWQICTACGIRLRHDEDGNLFFTRQVHEEPSASIPESLCLEKLPQREQVRDPAPKAVVHRYALASKTETLYETNDTNPFRIPKLINHEPARIDEIRVTHSGGTAVYTVEDVILHGLRHFEWMPEVLTAGLNYSSIVVLGRPVVDTVVTTSTATNLVDNPLVISSWHQERIEQNDITEVQRLKVPFDPTLHLGAVVRLGLGNKFYTARAMEVSHQFGESSSTDLVCVLLSEEDESSLIDVSDYNVAVEHISDAPATLRYSIATKADWSGKVPSPNRSELYLMVGYATPDDPDHIWPFPVAIEFTPGDTTEQTCDIVLPDQPVFMVQTKPEGVLDYPRYEMTLYHRFLLGGDYGTEWIRTQWRNAPTNQSACALLSGEYMVYSSWAFRR